MNLSLDKFSIDVLLQVKECVDVLVRYLDNIIGNPDETKFHKIRTSNTTFRDKVLPILGATDFLLAAGFQQQVLEHNGIEEEFWVFHENNIENLQSLEVLMFFSYTLLIPYIHF